MTLQEIADKLGFSVVTAYNLERSAIKKLKALFAEAGITESDLRLAL